ncbi:MAG: DEAD/DEAH box helicase [Sarcina sp.]
MGTVKNFYDSAINVDSFKDIESGKSIKDEILEASKYSLIDNSINANLALTPRLLINDYSKGTKVLSELISELNNCEEFYLSVAFITTSGITPLLETLKNLEIKGVKGKIITTDYLTFSEPRALRKLLNFSNIEIRVYSKENFHTKGYIFKHKNHYRTIVGSSNLTQTALTKNKEWNLKVSSLEDGQLTTRVIKEFNELWREAEQLTLGWIETYEDIYKKQIEFTRKSKVPRISQYKLRPNKMQIAAIESLNSLREEGKDKALLISATGTGKTYLAAFDLRNYNPKRVLFVVHREQIAKQAMESFKNVFGDNKSMGILSGKKKEVHCDFVFSTIQSLSKDEILKSFDSNHFDYIIIDEVHKAGAKTYDKILSYFKPEFLLGMTATPERTDDFDIFKVFDYNIAYEIRLKQALEEDLLCPFHYFGISDITVDGQLLDEKTEFNDLVKSERVDHIIEKINFYGFSGERVKGLIFCSNKEEGKSLSDSFNERGYNTIALTGENSQEEREKAIERLEKDQGDDLLDYIFTVDIFNEGVDIPSVNQVVMLRATKSSIVFIQQLGRGLRKTKEKEFVVVIDFVANYDNNFLIPIALSGDRSFNKDNIRKYVMEGTRELPGCSTINFDEVSKKKIFEAIDGANFNDVKLIRENYNNLKMKIGKIPTLYDFDIHQSIDPLRIFDKFGSYYNFLKKYEKDYSIRFNREEELFIEFVSKKLGAGKRVHELLLIKKLIEGKKNFIEELKIDLRKLYDIEFTELTKNNLVNILTNEFTTGTGKKTYESCIFIEKKTNKEEKFSKDIIINNRDNNNYNDEINNDKGNEYIHKNIADKHTDENDISSSSKNNYVYEISKNFEKLLLNKDFKVTLEEVIDFAIERYEKNYNERYFDSTFKLYEKYTYEDVCRLLEWEKGEVALNIGGYKYDKITKTYPVFINYQKDEAIVDTINYEDRFINESKIIAISKSGRTVQSEDVLKAYGAENEGIKMYLFVRKNKDDKTSKEFYFLGKIKAIGKPHQFVMKNTNKTAVEINYEIITPVREDVYDYLRS